MLNTSYANLSHNDGTSREDFVKNRLTISRMDKVGRHLNKANRLLLNPTKYTHFKEKKWAEASLQKQKNRHKLYEQYFPALFALKRARNAYHIAVEKAALPSIDPKREQNLLQKAKNNYQFAAMGFESLSAELNKVSGVSPKVSPRRTVQPNVRVPVQAPKQNLTPAEKNLKKLEEMNSKVKNLNHQVDSLRTEITLASRARPVNTANLQRKFRAAENALKKASLNKEEFRVRVVNHQNATRRGIYRKNKNPSTRSLSGFSNN